MSTLPGATASGAPEDPAALDPLHGLGAASARRYLRGNLPAVYSERVDGEAPQVMGLLEALEQVLDPVVIVLDNLAGHLDPATAPEQMLDFLLDLTGAPVDRTLPEQARRGLARDGARIAHSRGTRAGLQLALDRAFAHLKLEVLDNGRATWGPRAGRSADAAGRSADAAGRSADAVTAFEVLLPRAPTPLEREQLERCVADHLPAGARYRLRVPGG